MTSIHESSKIFAKEAKKSNRFNEQNINLTKNFLRVKPALITIIGRC